MLARLERIELLEREHARPGALLAELWALLAEAEAWTKAERHVPGEAIDAVERCRRLLETTGRTLLA